MKLKLISSVNVVVVLLDARGMQRVAVYISFYITHRLWITQQYPEWMYEIFDGVYL